MSVRYETIRRPVTSRIEDDEVGAARSHYELVRHEDGQEPDTVLSGGGLVTRLAIIRHLYEIAELGGPDARPALDVLKRGWSLRLVPPAPKAPETGE